MRFDLLIILNLKEALIKKDIMSTRILNAKYGNEVQVIEICNEAEALEFQPLNIQGLPCSHTKQGPPVS